MKVRIRKNATELDEFGKVLNRTPYVQEYYRVEKGEDVLIKIVAPNEKENQATQKAIRHHPMVLESQIAHTVQEEFRTANHELSFLYQQKEGDEI